MEEHTYGQSAQARVADKIRVKIETGELSPGQQLATFDVLAKEHMVSLSVIRKAVDLLKQQGLIVTRQGKGTFVRERPTARRHGIQRYARSIWGGGRAILVAEADEQGIKARQVMRDLAYVPAPDAVAERFGIEPGTQVWARKRTTLIDDRPNQLADSYYERSVVEGTKIMEEQTGPGGGFKVLEDSGHRLERITEELGVRMPTGPETVALDLDPGTPVMTLIRTTYTDKGRPVEVFLAVVAGDMASFVYDFPIPE